MDSDTGSSLTFDLRGLVWGIDSEVAQISSLCRRIDGHVREVNAARAQMAERLLVLDALVDAAEDPDLRRWLETVSAVPVPSVLEVFPDRLYTD
ncbi:MAG: hypothetical protein JWM62_996 [Frankiales bacterium]|jgi:hypothetical protein|nr:hypothetical protein [Frankiales bacterium]